MVPENAVANEPRLFVGQIPAEYSEENLWPLFSPYGTVRNIHILRGPDHKPRGCAMVLFQRWGEAEAAATALDGQMPPVQNVQSSGTGRPFVVHLANPRKATPGLPADPGLAPRKLFVGQVPRDVTEDMLKPYFTPYGDIEHINILRTQRGQSSGCGFVQFAKWAQAERAMEAHNGKTRLGSSEVPLVVKFADAKRRDSQQQGPQGMPFKGAANWLEAAGHHLADHGPEFPYQGGSHWHGGLMSQGLVNSNALNNSMAMQSLMASAYPYPGGYQLGDPSLHRGHLHDQGQHRDSRFQEHNPYSGGQMRGGSGLGGQAVDSLAGGGQLLQQGNSAGSLGSSNRHLRQGLTTAEPASSGSMGASSLQATSAVDLAHQLSELNIAGLQQPRSASEESNSAPFTPQQGELSDLNARPLPGAPGGSRQVAPQQNSQLQRMGLASGGPAYGQGHPLLGMQPPQGPGGEQGGRPWGQKISGNDKYNEWKLFVGQVPLEATEEDLWGLFSPLGQILELYVLRNNNGKSRGCAFVTYASKHLAEVAITQLNGRAMPSGKTLVVKFADRSTATKPLATGLLNMYMQH